MEESGSEGLDDLIFEQKDKFLKVLNSLLQGGCERELTAKPLAQLLRHFHSHPLTCAI